MAALYVAVGVQLRHTQAARDAIEQATLIRALLTRVGNDISNQAAPMIPPGTGISSGGGGGGGGAGASGGGAAAATSTGATGGATGATAGTTTGSSSTTSQSTTSTIPVPYNLNVQGSSTQVTLSLTMFPREVNVLSNTLTTQTLPIVSDQRFITYWLAGDSGNPLGLARQEIKVVTSDDATTMGPGSPNEASHVIAEEVKTLAFQYFDGSSWQDSWDGTQPGADGVTPMGPPQLISISVGVAAPGNDADGQPNLKRYRHVVFIPTSNGTTQANTSTTTSP
jgi:hypothetical protein